MALFVTYTSAGQKVCVKNVGAQRFPLVERWVGCGLRNQMRNSLVGTPSTRSVGVACEGHGAEAAPIRASRRQRPDPSGADSATRRTRATCQLPKMILVTYKSDVHPRSKVRKHGSRGRLQNGCSACRATPLARPMALPAWLTPGASGSPPVVSNLVSFTSAQERPRTAATPRCPSRRTSAGQGESWPADLESVLGNVWRLRILNPQLAVTEVRVPRVML